MQVTARIPHPGIIRVCAVIWASFVRITAAACGSRADCGADCAPWHYPRAFEGTRQPWFYFHHRTRLYPLSWTARPSGDDSYLLSTEALLGRTLWRKRPGLKKSKTIKYTVPGEPEDTRNINKFRSWRESYYLVYLAGENVIVSFGFVSWPCTPRALPGFQTLRAPEEIDNPYLDPWPFSLKPYNHPQTCHPSTLKRRSILLLLKHG